MVQVVTRKTRDIGNRAPRAPTLDRSASLSRGILHSWASTNGLMVDLAAASSPTPAAQQSAVIADLSTKVRDYNGSTSWDSVGDLSSFDRGAGDFCFDGWFVPGLIDNSTTQHLFGKDAAGQRQLALGINGGAITGERGRLYALYWHTSGTKTYRASTPQDSLAAGNLYHFVFQRVGTVMQAWLNGVSQTLTVAAGAVTGTMDSTSSSAEIGRRTYSGFNNPLTGKILFLNFRGVSLSAAEAVALYALETRWSMFQAPRRTYFIPTAAPPAGGAIMSQMQNGNLGADLFNGTIL